MKIDIVGNGCTWTQELSTSFIINDEVLFDTPQGSFKTLMHDYDLSKIKFIIISHFHSDHFAEIHLVLDYYFRCYPDSKLTIIAPDGCFERICKMFRLFEVAHLEEPLKQRVSFIVCENGKKFKLDSYKFQSFKMTHANLDAYGFVIENNGKKIGFSGDTAMCNNVRKILKKSSACFIDSANISPNNKHLSINEVFELQQEFSDCKLYPVHLSDNSMNELTNMGKKYLKGGDVVKFE